MSSLLREPEFPQHLSESRYEPTPDDWAWLRDQDEPDPHRLLTLEETAAALAELLPVIVRVQADERHDRAVFASRRPVLTLPRDFDPGEATR